MQRRSFLTRIPFLAAALSFAATAQDKAVAKLKKTAAEWKKLLPADSYRVLFEEATEPPGSSAFNSEKRAGTFVCAACNLPLFDRERQDHEWKQHYDDKRQIESATEQIGGILDFITLQHTLSQPGIHGVVVRQQITLANRQHRQRLRRQCRQRATARTNRHRVARIRRKRTRDRRRR